MNPTSETYTVLLSMIRITDK